MQKKAAQGPVCNQGVGKVVPSKPDNLSPRTGNGSTSGDPVYSASEP